MIPQTLEYTTKRQYTNFLSSLEHTTKDSNHFCKPSFPGHLLILSYAYGLRPPHLRQSFASVHVNGDKVNCPQGKRRCPGVHCGKQLLPLFIFHAIRRRKFLLWLGGFRIYERRVPIVRKANKSENNDARMKINKPYLTMITC